GDFGAFRFQPTFAELSSDEHRTSTCSLTPRSRRCFMLNAIGAGRLMCSVRQKRTSSPSTARRTWVKISDSHEEDARMQSSRKPLAEARASREGCVHIDRVAGGYGDRRHPGVNAAPSFVTSEGKGVFDPMQG